MRAWDVIFVKASMPSFKQQLRQLKQQRMEAAKKKSIHELIATIKALELIGQRGSDVDIQFRNRLAHLISSKAQA